MESSTLMLNFELTSKCFSDVLKTSTRRKACHHVLHNASSRFHFYSGKIKFESYRALCVHANSDKNVEGNGKHAKSTKHLDGKSTGDSGRPLGEDMPPSSSYDVPTTANSSLTTKAGDDSENVDSSVSLNTTIKIAANERGVSSPMVSKVFSESNKGTVLSKQIWSSSSANVSKTKLDPFSTTSSSQRGLSRSRQRVLDALRQSEKDGKLTKFGQPVVPSNLFDEPKSSESGSEPFSFNFSLQQFLPLLSFFIIALAMFGTAFVVWKVGAIHYNEF